MAPFRTVIISGIVVIGGFTLASLAFADGAEPGIADAEFMKMDTNRDGKVSADEHAAAAKQMFDTMDANTDGTVTAAEMETAHERVTGRKATKSDMSAAEKIKVVDTDGDGVLTAEEHARGSRTMFEKMDTGKDSFLTKDEFAAGHASLMKKPSH